VTIDHGAAEPLWQQLADVLRSKIESGELPAGRVIPSEATLSQEYGLSRGTVVKALDALERDGRPQARPGDIRHRALEEAAAHSALAHAAPGSPGAVSRHDQP
jgi:GntR family transcriptional regulator